jgi:hypothetical protein
LLVRHNRDNKFKLKSNDDQQVNHKFASFVR